MKGRWANDNRGWIRLTCDDRILYTAEGITTTVHPHCHVLNQCEPGVKKEPTRVMGLIGLFMAGNGPNWENLIGITSKFNPIQPDGITVSMRNIAVTVDPVLHSDEDKELVRQLQERLNALGCDVGTADGVAGHGREAALSCRAFPEGKMPDNLNVTTLARFVDSWSGRCSRPAAWLSWWLFPMVRSPIRSWLVRITARPAVRIRVDSTIVVTAEGHAIRTSASQRRGNTVSAAIPSACSPSSSAKAVANWRTSRTAAGIWIVGGGEPLVVMTFGRSDENFVIGGADRALQSCCSRSLRKRQF